jgi:hypothetical protein
MIFAIFRILMLHGGDSDHRPEYLSRSKAGFGNTDLQLAVPMRRADGMSTA